MDAALPGPDAEVMNPAAMLPELERLAAVAREADRAAVAQYHVHVGLTNDAQVAKDEYRAALRAFDAMLWGSVADEPGWRPTR